MLGPREARRMPSPLAAWITHAVLQARFLHQEIQRRDVGRNHDSAIVGPDPRQAFRGRPLRRLRDGPAGQSPRRADQQRQQGGTAAPRTRLRNAGS